MNPMFFRKLRAAFRGADGLNMDFFCLLAAIKSYPMTVMRPIVGERNAPIRVNRVVFPDPDGPVMMMISFGLKFRVNPFKMGTLLP